MASVAGSLRCFGPVALLALSPLLGVAPASAAVSEGSCVIVEAGATWGFKESFRAYISSSIAQGEWLVSGDVGYDTPDFVLTSGSGSLAPDLTSGDVSFSGAIEFLGHGGILDTTLGNPSLTMTGTREALLTLDVTGDTMEELRVDLERVPFATVGWSESDVTLDSESGSWAVQGAVVTLTREGAEAFGTYPPGETLDPLSWNITTTPGCLEQRGLAWGWILGGVAGLGVILAAGMWAIARGNKSRGPERP